MPSARLQRAVTNASDGAGSADFAAFTEGSREASVALAVALLAACVYAAFAHAAVASADEERLQLALAVMALGAAIACGRRRLSLRALPRLWLAVPRIAAADAARSLVEASTGTAAAFDRALADARRATDLDPLSDAGPCAAATIAIHAVISPSLHLTCWRRSGASPATSRPGRSWP